MQLSVSAGDVAASRGVWPTRHEHIVIAAFWLIYGAVSVLNAMYPPAGPGMPMSVRLVLGTGLEALIWLLGTPAVFWLTRRYPTDTVHQLRHLALYAAVGLLIAAINVLLVEFVRAILPLPRIGPVPYALSGRHGSSPSAAGATSVSA